MPSSVELACADPAMVRDVWPLARHLIKAAIDRTGLSDFAAIESEVLGGAQLLWLACAGGRVEAAATTQLLKVDGRKICVLVAAAGRGDWPALMGRIEDYAKAEGCAGMRIYGRKGWMRVLSGYRAKHVVLEKGFI